MQSIDRSHANAKLSTKTGHPQEEYGQSVDRQRNETLNGRRSFRYRGNLAFNRAASDLLIGGHAGLQLTKPVLQIVPPPDDAIC